MSDGIETALAEGQRHDVRHTKRLARLLDRLRARPVSSMPAACHGWAETVAAYRFLDTPASGIQDSVSGHPHAPLERLRAQAVVWLVQDPTFWDDGTTQPQAGMGPVKITVHEESLGHPTVAFTPARVNVGVVGMKVWQRPEPPVAQQRKSKPLAAQERDRGLAGYHCACAVQQAWPATLVVTMAAREGEIPEWLVAVMCREPGQRAEWIMRAKENRRLAPGAAPR
jgi:hypothetical protein